MSRLPLLVAAAMSATSGAYTIIYLYRWEWNRAAIAGLFFVATELIVVVALLLRRLHRIEARLDQLAERAPAPPPAGLEATLHDHRPAPHDHFGWLRGSASSSNVFLPVLLGLGVVASALAWVVEHVARLTASPALERRLARQLAPIGVPPGGLLAAPAPATVPARQLRAGRWVAAVILSVGTVAASAAGIDHLADQIQTRPDALDADVETVLELQLHGRVALDDPERTFTHLWSICTAPGVFSDRQLEPSTVVHRTGGSVQVVVPQDIGDRGVDRLTGCLRDTTLDRVQASVLQVRTVG